MSNKYYLTSDEWDKLVAIFEQDSADWDFQHNKHLPKLKKLVEQKFKVHYDESIELHETGYWGYFTYETNAQLTWILLNLS